MNEIKICRKCGNHMDTTKGLDWTCINCGYTQWGIISFYGIFAIACLGAAVFWSSQITHAFLRFIVRWGVGIIGAIVMLAVVLWVVNAIQVQVKKQRKSDISNEEILQQSANSDEQITHVYPNGNTYVGSWKDGNMNGWGTLSDPYGYFKFEGHWKNGKLDGLGTKITTGMKYEGEWKDGQYNGRGRLDDELGKFTYIGEFVEGQMTGKGTMKFPDGTVRTGIFEKGEFIR